MAIINWLKYDGGPDVFAWKHPEEELSTWTQLIVNESQEAVLFREGRATDVFQAGRYTLTTENIPILAELMKLPFGGRSPFTAEVWYINKAMTLDIKWGTPSPIQLQDPKYKMFLPVRSYGRFGLRIEDSKRFLFNLVGTMSIFDRQTMEEFFKGLYLTKVRDAISSYLVHKKISILEINAYIDEISDFVYKKISPVMFQYGIELMNFYINDISVPEDDSAVKTLKDALAKKAEMDIIGYDYTQERSFDTLEGAAKNPGSSNSALLGAGLGLGMGAGIGRLVGGMAQELRTTPKEPTPAREEGTKCPQCGSIIAAGKRFCGECGYDTHRQERGASKRIRCSQCGHEYDSTAKFCPECGDRYTPCPNCQADVKEDAKVCPECGYALPRPCPNCNARVDADAKFCPECGQPLVKKCANCQTVLEPGAKFCPECGTKVEE